MISSFFKNLTFVKNKQLKVVGENSLLNQSIEVLLEDLGNSLISCDISMVGVKKSIAGYNTQHSITNLFADLNLKFKKALKDSNFPTIGDYYMLNLANDYIILVLYFQKFQWVILLSKTKVNMGVLHCVTIPKIKKLFGTR